MVPQTALDRFKSLASGLHQLYAASGDCQRRLNDALQAKHRLVAERERIAPNAKSPWTRIADRARERLASLDRDIVQAQTEIDRLKSELAAIEAKRCAASELVGNCKTFLSERGAPSGLLEY